MSTGALLGHGLGGMVEHTVSEDGLLLTSLYTSPDGGTITSRVTWRERTVAEENYANAMRSFEDRVVTAFAPKLSDPDHDGNRRRVRKRQTRFGTLYLGANTGRPTWLRPRVNVGLRDKGHLYPRVMVGWLRAAVYLHLDPSKRA